MIRNINKATIKNTIINFLNKDGIDYLCEMAESGNFYLAWGSYLYGNIGMQVRNHLRDIHPDIIDNFKNYGDFEDYITNLMIEILKEKYEVCITEKVSII